MNGVSHMLLFVVAGGVLIAISFAVWGIYSFDPTNAQYNATAAMLKSVGDAAMGMMVPILSAYIAEGIAKRPGLVVGLVGGLVANAGGTGFLGGILSGFLAGYFILLLQKLLKNLPKSLDGLKAIFLYPVIGVATIGTIMALLAEPMKMINEGMMNWLASFQHSSPLVLGIIAEMYKSLQEHMVTDVELADMVELLLALKDINMENISFQTLQGEIVLGEDGYEEFYPDEQQLQTLQEKFANKSHETD